MRGNILCGLFVGMLAFAPACGDGASDDIGSYAESALKGGKSVDGGVAKCKCKGKSGEDHGNPDAGKSGEDHGKRGEDRGNPDAGKSAEDHGKPDTAGKSGEDRGKPDVDDDASNEEDLADDELDLEREARKVYPDGGVKKAKKDKSEDCSC